VDRDSFLIKFFNQISVTPNLLGSAKSQQGNDESDDDEEEVPLRSFSLEDLKTRFKPHSVMNAMSCAGNRRRGMKEVSKDVQGNDWYVGAIGNAVFTGVRILDLLLDLGFKLEDLKDKHLIAESLDADILGKCFEVSIPMSIAIDPRNEIILAY
jgi:sulfite oxidase